jgi:hypothetical protein
LIARTALSPRQTDTTQMFGLLCITQLTRFLRFKENRLQDFTRRT